jgi:hypothetical protein
MKRYLFLFLALSLFHTSIFSKNTSDEVGSPECELLLEILKRDYTKYNFDQDLSNQTYSVEGSYISSLFTGGIFFKKDFAEAYSKTEYRSYLRNQAGNIFLEALSPDLFSEYSEFFEWVDDSPIYDFKAKELLNGEVISINDSLVSAMSDYEIQETIFDSTLEIVPVKFQLIDINKNIRSFEVNFGQDLQSRVAVPIEVLDVYEINSLGSSFKARYREKYMWWQYGLNEIGSEVLKSVRENTNTDDPREFNGFACEFNSGRLTDQFFIPDIKLANIISEDIIDDKIIFNFSEEEIDETLYPSSSWLRVTEKVATLKTKFNYRAFPFDSQEISFKFEPRDSLNIIPYLAFDSPMEWSLKRMNLNNWKAISYKSENYIFQGDQGFDRVGLEIAFNFDRHSLYYVLKIYLPLLIVLMVSLSVLYINPLQIESRLTVSVVCFLALITYTYIVDKDIPKLSYLTVMDYVILLSYFFSALPTIQSIYINNIAEQSQLRAIKVNDAFKFWMPILYFSGVLVIVFAVINSSSNIISALQFTI